MDNSFGEPFGLETQDLADPLNKLMQLLRINQCVGEMMLWKFEKDIYTSRSLTACPAP